MVDCVLRPPGPERQLGFHQLLVAARKTVLVDALKEALAKVDPCVLRAQVLEYAPPDALSILATAGIRDEQVFPTPVLLEAMPTLLGYYRLLLGSPQKSFYRSETGMGQFKGMEAGRTLTERQRAMLPDLCKAMSTVLADLVLHTLPAGDTLRRDGRFLAA
jgi:hypothetical protein